MWDNLGLTQNSKILRELKNKKTRDNMKVLRIIEKDRVGLIMDISYILGKSKINIENISVITSNGKVIILLQVKDEEKVKEILKRNGFNVLEDDVLIIKLEDKPGQLAEVSQILSQNNISIENLYIVSKNKKDVYVSVKVDDPKKAKKVLKEYLIENPDF